MKQSRAVGIIVCLMGLTTLMGSCTSGSDDIEPGNMFYDDTSMKAFGVAPLPPFFVDPENPAAGGPVEITIAIEGADAIEFTATGPGCGTIAAIQGASPLTISGTAGTSGYCDMTATANGGVIQSYAGRFEVEATDPNIPPVGISDSAWEEEALPTSDAGAPVINAINGSTSLDIGSTSALTIDYTGDEALTAVLLQVAGYPNGFFYTSTSGMSGSAGFSIEAAPLCAAGTYAASVIVIDELDRVSSAFPLTITVTATSANLASPRSATMYRVSGKALYEKFIVSETGRASTGVMVPVRRATVKAISARDGATILATGTTRDDGSYVLSFANSSSNKSYTVQVYATSDTLLQSVMNKNGAIYAYRSPSNVDGSEEPDKTNFNLEISEANNAGAFNIWDVGVSANAYAKSITGTAPPRLNFLWTRGEFAKGSNGSYYTTDDATGIPLIAMTGAPADPDEYDDMVIGHEYGHFVMANYSTDDSPGGTHYLDQYAVPTLALSEAWATFFAGATLGRSVYLDSNATGIGVSYSFETPPASAPRGTNGGTLNGNVNEIVANAVLWDLFDTTNETMDTLENRSEAIWKVLTVYLKSGYAKFSDRGYTGRDLVDFLDGWICLGFGDIGSDNTQGLRGAAIGLMQFPESFISSTLASCR